MIQLLQGYHFDGDPLEELFEVLGTIELVLEDFEEARDAIASRLDEKTMKDLCLIASDLESSQSALGRSAFDIQTYGSFGCAKCTENNTRARCYVCFFVEILRST